MKSICLVIVSLMVTACSKEFKPLQVNELLIIHEFEAGPYYADGATKIPVTLEFLDELPDATYRTITFETEGGTIEPSEIVVSKKLETVFFTPDIIAGTFSISAVVKNKKEIKTRQSITLQSNPADSVIQFEFSNGKNTFLTNVNEKVQGKVKLVNTLEKTIELKLSNPQARFLPVNQENVTAEVNANGEFLVEISNGLVEGDFYLEVGLVDDRGLLRRFPYQVKKDTLSNVLQLELDPGTDTVRANSLDLVKGEAIVLEENVSSITLSSNDPDAKFLPELKQSVTRYPDGSGRVQFEMFGSLKPGLYQIEAEIEDSRGLKVSTPYIQRPMTSSEVLALFYPPGAIFANGVSNVPMRISVSDYPSTSAVNVTVTGGSIAQTGMRNYSATPDQNGDIFFNYLVDNQPGNIYVTYALQNSTFSSTSVVPVDTAFPDSIRVIPNKYEVNHSGSGNLSIDIYSYRNAGLVSSGIPFVVTATSGGNNVGLINTFPITSGMNQQANFIFNHSTRQAPVGATIDVTVSCRGSSGNLIQRTIQLTVVP